MENKYYTPDISEFHVGFEYEMSDGYSWTNQIFPLPWWDGGGKGMGGFYVLKNCINQKNIRVKYLDKEDIENLGFKYIKTYAGLNEDYFEHKNDEYYLDYDYESKFIRIAMYGEGDITRFSGEIKNKSELKRLLKQLNIC